MKNLFKDNVAINRTIFVLSLLGIVMAAYVLQGWLRNSPLVCLNGSECSAVAKSPLSHPFGIPVPAVGLVGYAFMTILAFLRTMSNDKRLLWGILGMGAFGVCFVTWFTYTEIFLIHAVCTWCAVSAVNMYVIFFLTLRTLRLAKNK